MKRNLLIAFRLFFGVLDLVAIGIQFGISMSVGFSPVSFFSYFTNLSNVLVSVILILSALSLMKGREPSRRDDSMRGVGVTFITLVFLVYITLLRDVDLGALQPWINTQLHIVMPLAVIVDWLIQPPKSKLTLRDATGWVVFPIAYVAYTLTRGAIINWYPYPFLNPATAGGYGGVALYVAAMVAGFFLISWLWITLGNRLERNVESK